MIKFDIKFDITFDQHDLIGLIGMLLTFISLWVKAIDMGGLSIGLAFSGGLILGSNVPLFSGKVPNVLP